VNIRSNKYYINPFTFAPPIPGKPGGPPVPGGPTGPLSPEAPSKPLNPC